MSIERARLVRSVEVAFDSQVERLFSTYALGVATDTTALTHFEAGLRSAVKCRDHALSVAQELTPNG